MISPLGGPEMSFHSYSYGTLAFWGSSGTTKAVSLALLVGSWISFDATLTMIFWGVGTVVVASGKKIDGLTSATTTWSMVGSWGNSIQGEMVNFQKVNLTKYQLAKRPPYQKVNLPKGQLAKRSTCQKVNLPKGQLAKRLTCQKVNLPKGQLVKRSTCQKVNLTKGQLNKRSTCQKVNLPKGQLAKK